MNKNEFQTLLTEFKRLNGVGNLKAANNVLGDILASFANLFPETYTFSSDTNVVERLQDAPEKQAFVVDRETAKPTDDTAHEWPVVEATEEVEELKRQFAKVENDARDALAASEQVANTPTETPEAEAEAEPIAQKTTKRK